MVDKVEEIIGRYPDIWKTKSSFMSWVRGGIRRGLWNRAPIKIKVLNDKRRQIKNPNPRGKKETVWGADCSLCGEEFPIAQIEVDHIRGNHSLSCVEDIHSFIESIILITEDDLQLVCKDCHKIKSMADKQGISFKQAQAEKLAISLCKEKGDKGWLEGRGIVPASNQAKRREQIVEEVLRGG